MLNLIFYMITCWIGLNFDPEDISYEKGEQ